MFNAPNVAGLLVFVFYAVSFTKFFFDPIAQPKPEGRDKKGNVLPAKPGNPSLQAGLVRLWALVLGIGGAIVDSHFSSNAAWTGPQVYDAIKAGSAGAIGAVITYHIGQPGFLGVFDGGGGVTQTTTTTIAGSTKTTEPVAVVATDTVGVKPLTVAAVTPASTTSTNGAPGNSLPSDFKPYTPSAPVEVPVTPTPATP